MSTAPPQTLAATSPHRPGTVLAAATVAALAAVLAFTRVWNFDIFWHLACGRWMFQHGRVLDFDPFTADPANPGATWVNIHWGFQLLVTALHALGGFALLTVLKAALAGGTGAILAFSQRKRTPAAWLLPAGALAVWVMAPRFRVRPESVTLLLLTATIVLVEAARRDRRGRQLWWLVPIFAIWVNLQGLFVLGLGIVGSAIGGAWLDRALGRRDLAGALAEPPALLAALAATAATLLTPWPVRAFLHPLLLWTRIADAGGTYARGVSELHPLFTGGFFGSISAVQDRPFALLLVVLTAAMMLAAFIRGRLVKRPAVPLSHPLWLGVFVVLAGLAQRNLALLGPVAGYLLMVHGADALAGLGRLGRRWANVLLGGGMLLALAVMAGAASGWLFYLTGQTWQFGPGLQAENYHLQAADLLANLPGQGAILCENFGNASPFIYTCPPKRKTWMDGRLEAHPPGRFARQSRYFSALRHLGSARRLARLSGEDGQTLPRCVRFVVVWHNQRHLANALTVLSSLPEYQLVWVEPAGATFARRDWPPPVAARASGQLPPMANLPQLDRPLTAEMSIAGVPVARRTFWSANPFSAADRLGGLLYHLAETPDDGNRPFTPVQARCGLLGLRYLRAAAAENVSRRPIAAGSLAQAHRLWAWRTGQRPSQALPIDVHQAAAIYHYRRARAAANNPGVRRRLGLSLLGLLLQAGHVDAAEAELKTLSAAKGDGDHFGDVDELAAAISAAREHAHSVLAGMDLQGAPPLRRARALSAPRVGLTARALAVLAADAANADADSWILRGDLLARQGRVKAAHAAYARAGSQREPELAMRLALLDWIAGRWHGARARLEAISPAARSAPAELYLAELLETVGDYPAAEVAVGRARSRAGEEAHLQRRIEAVSDRLAARVATSGR